MKQWHTQKSEEAEKWQVMNRLLEVVEVEANVGISKTQARKEMAPKSLSFLKAALADAERRAVSGDWTPKPPTLIQRFARRLKSASMFGLPQSLHA